MMPAMSEKATKIKITPPGIKASIPIPLSTYTTIVSSSAIANIDPNIKRWMSIVTLFWLGNAIAAIFSFGACYSEKINDSLYKSPSLDVN
jgi:hypothetical protein